MDFFPLTGGERPNFRTISKFRQRHLPALGGLFVEILKICRAAGLAKLGHVALDGTKMAANASKHKAMSYERMSQEERRLAAEVARWLEEAEAVDADNQIIVAADLTQQQNDGHMLDPMMSQLKRNCGRQAHEVSADAGYRSEEDLALLRKRHIRAYVATGRRKHGTSSATGSGRQPRPLRAAMATLL